LYSTISRNAFTRALILSGVPFFFSFFLSSPSYFLQTSAAGVRRMRRLIGAVLLVNSRKFSSWRRDALEGALVRSTSIPGKRRRVRRLSRNRRKGKKGKDSKRSKRERARNRFPPSPFPEIARAIQSREMLQCNRHALRGNYGIITV